jgi:flagellar biosynthesis chaperone FliJ
MGGVYDEQWQGIRDEIEAVAAYNEVQNQKQELVKKRESNLETGSKKLVEQLKSIQNQKKEYQRQVKNKLDQLVEVLNTIPVQQFLTQTTSAIASVEGGVSSSGSAISSSLDKTKNKVDEAKSKVDSVKKIFVKTLNRVRSELPELFIAEVINQLGCSQEQTFLGNDVSNLTNQTGANTNSLYIPIQSIDLFGILQTAPNSKVGKIFYETGTTYNVQANGTYPFNKDLHELTQTPGQTYLDATGDFYNGVSGQPLFNIEFTTTDNLGNPGGFFKIDLINRPQSNIVSQFFTDYYGKLELVNLQNIFGQIFDAICGAVSIEMNLSSQQLEVKGKYQLLLQRVLGLCFDQRQEIDVSGIAKVSPTQDVDASFFQFNEIDLREIDYTIENLRKGVVEFQDCDNVKLPVNNEEITNQILSVLSANTSGEILQAFESVESTFVDNLQNNIAIPGLNLRLVVDTELLKAIPQALYSSILTPKIILGFYMMLASILPSYRQLLAKVQNIVQFSEIFSKLFINLSSKVMAKFIKILVQEIKKEIVLLMRIIIRELKKNGAKKEAIILQLLTVSGLLVKLFGDYRRCQSIIDEIQQIFQVALTGTKIEIPAILLPLSKFRSGYSEARANLEIVKEFQKVGIPTGAMPSGAPNFMTQSFFGSQQGSERERALNSKTSVLVPLPPAIGLGAPQPPVEAWGLNI